MKRLRFLHIPKTAGSTFTDILSRQYSGTQHFQFLGDNISDKKRFEEMPVDDRRNVRLFTGHAPIVTGISEADTATIITILRDPIERVKSFCQHVSEGKSPYLLKDFPPERFNLDEFLESGNEELSNLQAKMLINGGHICSPKLIDSMPVAKAANLALTNLFNRVSYFGIQQYFDESLIMFSESLNWKLPLYVHLNKKRTFKRLKFEDRHLQRIEELNPVSIEVYNRAKERFVEMMNSDAFEEAKLKRFRLVNKVLGRPVYNLGRIRSKLR